MKKENLDHKLPNLNLDKLPNVHVDRPKSLRPNRSMVSIRSMKPRTHVAGVVPQEEERVLR